MGAGGCPGGLAGLSPVGGLWGGGLCQQGACSTWGQGGSGGRRAHPPAAVSLGISAVSPLLSPLPCPSSLSAAPLVSSSLTYGQDEVPRLPPGARSLRSAPSAAGGVARCCLALWSSEQVDRHLLPPCGPGSDSRLQMLPTHTESPPRAHVSQGGWGRISGLSRPGPHTAHCGPLGCSYGQPTPPSCGAGPLAPCPCLCLSCVCPFLCCVLCLRPFSWSTPAPSPPRERVCCVELGACA